MNTIYISLYIQAYLYVYIHVYVRKNINTQIYIYTLSLYRCVSQKMQIDL